MFARTNPWVGLCRGVGGGARAVLSRAHPIICSSLCFGLWVQLKESAPVLQAISQREVLVRRLENIRGSLEVC